ncbi:fungal-specific transcription factor domain-containing protein [Aspergillus aurantiobrunneus]
MEHSTPKRRRSFKIKTKFGAARQWRSRKNPPCDACRRRKTACIIETVPPCRFCRAKGRACTSTESPRERSRELAESDSTVVDPSYTTFLSLLSPEIGPDSILTPAPTTDVASTSHRTEATSQTSPGSYTLMTSPLSENGPTVDTLEDNENRTAHSVGLSGEQDTDLLASFRSVITNEKDGISADFTFNLLMDEFQPADDLAKFRISDKIEYMVSPNAATLVRLFFKHVHPVYCVVSKVRFLKAYAEDKPKIPASLRGAVYGLGSAFWQHDPDVGAPLQFDLHYLFKAAQSSLQRELHAPNIWGIQACLLLLYKRPADNVTIETPRTWIFSSRIVACAQMIGLHHDSSMWHLVPAEKKLRKKLWWATYLTDIWSSVCHGNLPLVYPGSFTTTPPGIDDLAFDEEVHRTVNISASARFLEMIKLSQILHELVDLYYLDVSYQQTITQPQSRETNLLRIRGELETWSSMLPNCVTMDYTGDATVFCNNAPLNLAYFAVQALLFRALMSPARMSAKSDPNLSLCRCIDLAVNEFQNFTLFMDRITWACLHAFWGSLHAAFELLGSFNESLQRLREWANNNTLLALLRPVAFHMDLFFLHAARIMRNGIVGM